MFFVFSEHQMRRKISACEATFSPSTEMWPKITPAIQPNTSYLHLLSFNEETTPPHVLWSDRASMALVLPHPNCLSMKDSRRRRHAECEQRGHSAHGFWWHHCSFLHGRASVFSQDVSVRNREQLSVLVFVFFRVMRIKVTHVLWGCGSGFFSVLQYLFFFFFS